jgi:cation transport ATPase/regulator of protease activity HflC (stomatin/prohibitin superfamily)
MHREISPTDRLGYTEPPLSLYLLTALLGLLIGLDVWPALVSWLGESGTWLPTWPREVFAYRFALVAAVLGGARTLFSSLESLFEGRLGADLAIAIACVAAILIGEPLVAAEVVFIGMVGEVLESFTFQRTQRAIQGLVEITPRRCWLLRDGQEVRVMVSELKVGDVVVVKPGARIPADGTVLNGQSTLDVSALTGESLPAEKGPGDEVLAGALNQTGALTVEARRVAEQTVVGRVLELTIQALQQKSHVERTADRLARYFLPAVLSLATVTFLVALVLNAGSWGRTAEGVRLTLGEAARLATYPALSVLVVACPCALILATPAAILAALGRLAGTGVLIKGGVALERLAEVNTFAFDKTGTLTEGRLELGDVLPVGNVTPDELLRAAATAEQRSEHPLASVVLTEATARGFQLPALEEFQAHPGGGITARTERNPPWSRPPESSEGDGVGGGGSENDAGRNPPWSRPPESSEGDGVGGGGSENDAGRNPPWSRPPESSQGDCVGGGPPPGAPRNTALESSEGPCVGGVAAPLGSENDAEGTTLVVGTRRLMEEQGIHLSADVLALLERLDDSGQTALLVARDGQLLGAIGARDRVRPEAADVLAELRNLGIADIVLLTGDRRAVALAVAERLKISEVHAELLPEQKAELISRLSGGTSPPLPVSVPSHAITTAPTEKPSPETKSVAMVGDGINDAPALARAHVGLAIGGTGTDVAAEAGDVVFMGDPLRSLPLLVRLSRETVRIIRQNIILFAFAVNAAGIVITAWLWPLLAPAGWWYEQSPLAAVIYHQLGSLFVLLNSMRLLWFERPANPRTAAWRRRLVDVNAWMERNLNLDEWLHGLTHHLGKALAAVVGVALIVYALSGLTQVNADEVGVVRRFGRVVRGELEPGLHWRFPWPVETVTRVRPAQIRSVEVGFRSVGPAVPDTADTRSWASLHGDAIRRYPDESVMITGDGNLVEVLATVHYTVSDVHVYLFEVSDPEEVLRLAAEAVLREAVAGRGFTPLLTSRRREFQQHVLAKLRDRVSALGQGIGVKVERISLQELHPPPEVVDDYHAVARAGEREKELINRALADKTKQLQRAEADRVEMERNAEAERHEVLRSAQAALAVFTERWKARRDLSLETETRLFLEALSRLRAGQSQEQANALYARLRREARERQARFSDDRLRREVLARTLSDREMILVDAARPVASFLYALDQLREAMPRFIPVDRGPPERSP